jgi:GTP cyclohydrolase IA
MTEPTTLLPVPNLVETLEERIAKTGALVHDEDYVKAGIRALLRLMGEDPNREGLVKTPERVLKAYRDLTSRPGNPAELLSVQFGDEPADEMIVVGPISFTSICEHHLLPFTGSAWVAYIPTDSKVVGLSKLARLVDHFAKRPQVQERLTRQVVNAIGEHLSPEGAACVVRATHACLSLRGASKVGSLMTTSALTGILKHDAKARAEFMEFSRA